MAPAMLDLMLLFLVLCSLTPYLPKMLLDKLKPHHFPLPLWNHKPCLSAPGDAPLCLLRGRVFMVACVQLPVCTCVNCPVSRYDKHVKWVQIPAEWSEPAAAAAAAHFLFLFLSLCLFLLIPNLPPFSPLPYASLSLLPPFSFFPSF